MLNSEPIPSDVEAMPPGAMLGLVLESIDPAGLNGHDLALYQEACHRQASRLQAMAYDSTAELAYCPPGGADAAAERSDGHYPYAADELALVSVLTRRAAETRLGLALDLHDRLPRVLEALFQGRIDLARARVLVDGTSHLPETIARGVIDAVMSDAGGWTTGQLRARVRRLCIEVTPDDARDRYDQSVEQRSVVAYPDTDGTATLVGSGLPPDRVAAAMEYINRLARSLTTKEETRPMDQLRTDVYVDLLKGTKAGTGRESQGVVDIVVDIETLAKLSNRTAEIPGWGPVIADIARQVAAEHVGGQWRVTVADPDDGAVLWNGTTRRRPTARQRRYTQARHRTCIFPGRRMPSLHFRPRPHHRVLQRRANHRRQYRTPLSPPPSSKTLRRMASTTTRPHHLPVDNSPPSYPHNHQSHAP